MLIKKHHTEEVLEKKLSFRLDFIIDVESVDDQDDILVDSECVEYVLEKKLMLENWWDFENQVGSLHFNFVRLENVTWSNSRSSY